MNEEFFGYSLNIMREPLDNFYLILRCYRNEKKITQVQLSELLDVSPSYVAMLETGQRSPSFAMLFRVAKALGVKASEIVVAMEQEAEKENSVPKETSFWNESASKTH